MTTALISLIALALAIAIGYIRKVNIGVVSIAIAFIVGYFLVGMKPAEIIGGWPLKLFFVLLGMTFLFSIASTNGTLPLLARKLTHLVGGNRKLVPPVFFLISALLASMGPGNISICALLCPIALAVASEERISPLLMAAMVMAGANAGGLSPIAPTGIIGIALAHEIGLDTGMVVFIKQIIGQSVFASLLYIAFRAYRLKKVAVASEAPPPFSPRQRMTIMTVLLVVAAIVLGKWDIGLTAFLGAAALVLLHAADETEAVAAIPWPTLILICGVGVLVNVTRVAGGIEQLTTVLAMAMTPRTVAPIMAITGGLMSFVSSASGVVMPTLIPTVPQLVERVGGDPAEVISAIIMGSHMVTNSPMSTLGALAMASAGKDLDRTRLFNGLLALAGCGVTFAAVVVFFGII